MTDPRVAAPTKRVFTGGMLRRRNPLLAEIDQYLRVTRAPEPRRCDCEDEEEVHPCLAVDFHNTRPRSSHLLCHRPCGHDGDHGNARYTWPA